MAWSERPPGAFAVGHERGDDEYAFVVDEYDRAAAGVWMGAVDALLSAYSPWLASIDREHSEHARTIRVSAKRAPDLVSAAIDRHASIVSLGNLRSVGRCGLGPGRTWSEVVVIPIGYNGERVVSPRRQ